jgi:hypothetical protein
MGWEEVDGRSHSDAERQDHVALVALDVLWVVEKPLMPFDRKRQSTSHMEILLKSNILNTVPRQRQTAPVRMAAIAQYVFTRS